jgi:hypothetical protein
MSLSLQTGGKKHSHIPNLSNREIIYMERIANMEIMLKPPRIMTKAPRIMLEPLRIIAKAPRITLEPLRIDKIVSLSKLRF